MLLGTNCLFFGNAAKGNDVWVVIGVDLGVYPGITGALLQPVTPRKRPLSQKNRAKPSFFLKYYKNVIISRASEMEIQAGTFPYEKNPSPLPRPD
jgi:hypothetical protein